MVQMTRPFIFAFSPSQRSSQPQSYWALCIILSQGSAHTFFIHCLTRRSSRLPPPRCLTGSYPDQHAVAIATPTTSPLSGRAQPGPCVLSCGSRVSRSMAISLAALRSGNSEGGTHSVSGGNKIICSAVLVIVGPCS